MTLERGARRAILGCALLCLVTAAPVAGNAQDLIPPRLVGVRDRARPEYDPVGIPLGSFRFFPGVTVGVARDDNVFATQTDSVEDRIALLGASLNVTSTGAGLPMSARVAFDSGSYSDYDTEDFLDRTVGASVSHEFARNTSIELGADYARSHLPRSDPSVPFGAAEPPTFSTSDAVLKVRHAFASGELAFEANFGSSNYDDVATAETVLDQDFRDRDNDRFVLEGQVAISSSMAAFVRAIRSERDYDFTEGALNRDATSDTLLGGVALDLTNLMRGEVALGLLHVDNVDPAQPDSRSLAVRSNVEFFVTQLITATIDLDRTSGAADFGDFASYVETNAALRVDYELRRNVVLSARLNGLRRRYGGVEKSDRTEIAAIGARWYMNRRLRLDAEYATLDRDQPVALGVDSFSGETATIAVRFAL